MAGEEVNVSSLNPNLPVMMRKGVFDVRPTYRGTTRNGYPATYVASPDKEWMSSEIGENLPRSCEVKIEMLSRDECEVFADPKNVGFRGGPDNPVMPGTTLSWWHLSKMDDIAEQVKRGYRKIVETSLGAPYIIEDEDDIFDDLCTSDLFKESYSRGYIARALQSEDPVPPPVPNARYHCGLNELISSYKELLGIEEVQFRIHGSTFYPYEIMHSILICPTTENPTNVDIFGSNLEDHLEAFPEITVGEFTTEEEPLTVTENVVIERNEEGRYRFIWRPWCTRSGLQWDHLTVAFLLPERLGDQEVRLRLPLPYYRQDKPVPVGHRYKDNMTFNPELIKVEAQA